MVRIRLTTIPRWLSAQDIASSVSAPALRIAFKTGSIEAANGRRHCATEGAGRVDIAWIAELGAGQIVGPRVMRALEGTRLAATLRYLRTAMPADIGNVRRVPSRPRATRIGTPA